MFKLIAGGEVYAPERLGKVNILLAGDKIAAIGEDLKPPSGYECEVFVQTAFLGKLPGKGAHYGLNFSHKGGIRLSREDSSCPPQAKLRTTANSMRIARCIP